MAITAKEFKFGRTCTKDFQPNAAQMRINIFFLKKDRTIAGYTFPLVTQLRKDKTHHRCLPFVNFIQILRAINTQAKFISFCHLSFAMRDSECYSVADDDKPVRCCT